MTYIDMRSKMAVTTPSGPGTIFMVDPSSRRAFVRLGCGAIRLFYPKDLAVVQPR